MLTVSFIAERTHTSLLQHLLFKDEPSDKYIYRLLDKYLLLGESR